MMRRLMSFSGRLAHGDDKCRLHCRQQHNEPAVTNLRRSRSRGTYGKCLVCNCSHHHQQHVHIPPSENTLAPRSSSNVYNKPFHVGNYHRLGACRYICTFWFGYSFSPFLSLAQVAEGERNKRHRRNTRGFRTTSGEQTSTPGRFPPEYLEMKNK